MQRMLCAVLIGLAGTFAAGVARAQLPDDGPAATKTLAVRPPTDAGRPSIEPAPDGAVLDPEVRIGTKAPGFDLDGSRGARVRLADLQGGWAVLAFSEHPAFLAALDSVSAGLDSSGVRLVGICSARTGALASLAKRRDLAFVLLSDWTRQIAQVYGMYDADADAIRPGLVLLDPQGVVRVTLPGSPLAPVAVLRLVRQALQGV